MLDLPSFLVSLAIFFAITWLITRFFRPEKLKVDFTVARKEASIALGYTVAAFIMLAVVFFLWSQSIGLPIGTSNEYNVLRVLYEWMVYAIISFVPILVILRIRHQNLESVGFTTKNLRLSIAVGLVLSALWLAFNTTPELFLTRALTSNAFYGFFYFLGVGLGEELLFRGFLQLRFVAWLGELKGLIAASVVMAFTHLPQRLFVAGMNPLQAMISATLLIPVSLLLGFVMLRTQNVLGPTVLHTIMDLTNVLS